LAENKKRSARKKRSKARKTEEAILADQAFEASLAEGLAPTPVKARAPGPPRQVPGFAAHHVRLRQ